MDRWIKEFKDKRGDLMGCVINTFSVRGQIMLLGPDDGMLCKVVAKLLIRRSTSFFIS
jgi:hypothetical protein